MPSFETSLAAIVAALAESQGVPPRAGVAAGLEPFPALVSVLLARAADPGRAARGLNALADAGLLDPRALAGCDLTEIVDTLKSCGVSVPARGLAPLQRLARRIADRPQGGAEALAAEGVSTESLREELAGLNGIGPATADALLILALNRPAYPIDRATYRILVRHGWLDPSAGYDEARAVVEGPSPDDPETLVRLSAGFERIGREFCRVGAPKCDRCPLRPFLPEGGPLAPEP
jgi:endonuclease III related protein